MRWTSLGSAALLPSVLAAGGGRRLLLWGGPRGRQLSSLAEKATRLWVRLFVRDLGLCPFVGWVATETDDLAGLRVVTTGVEGRRPDLVAIASEVVDEARLLLEDGPRSTLLLYPALTDFDDYLDAAEAAEEALRGLSLDDRVQLATFHPRYLFREEGASCASHWTNRSPFPMLHLLRVEDVSRAVESYRRSGGTDAIWRRNKLTMLSLGTLRLEEMRREVMRRAAEEDGDTSAR